MGKIFSVQSRLKCKICGEVITKKYYRTYCSAKCRNKAIYRKNKKRIQQWQTNKRAEYAPNKIRCLICGKWYYQVCSHVYNKHKMTAREYKELYGLDVKRGILPEFLREIKADHVFDNGTVNNLKAGKKFWFKPGDEKAGKYKRSRQTLERLKKLHLFNK